MSERKPRAVYPPEMKTVFSELYRSFEGGNFAKFINIKDVSLNVQKGVLWDRFTEQFNKVSGTEYTKKQLQNYLLIHSQEIGTDLSGEISPDWRPPQTSCTEEPAVRKRKTPRSRFPPSLKSIFIKLYKNYDNGNFARMLNDIDHSENCEKAVLWQTFTAAFNRIAGTQYTKKQLQRYHTRCIKLLAKGNGGRTANGKKSSKERRLEKRSTVVLRSVLRIHDDTVGVVKSERSTVEPSRPGVIVGPRIKTLGGNAPGAEASTSTTGALDSEGRTANLLLKGEESSEYLPIGGKTAKPLLQGEVSAEYLLKVDKAAEALPKEESPAEALYSNGETIEDLLLAEERAVEDLLMGEDAAEDGPAGEETDEDLPEHASLVAGEVWPSRRPRINLTPEMRSIFTELCVNHAGGRFLQLLKSNSPSENMEKAALWESFTLAFNLAAGTQATKQQLQGYHLRNTKDLIRGGEFDQLAQYQKPPDGQTSKHQKETTVHLETPVDKSAEMSPSEDCLYRYGLTKKRRSRRISFTPEMRKVFFRLYKIHADVLSRNVTTENMEKAAAWDNFTTAFNMATGMDISKGTLQSFCRRNIARKNRDNSDLPSTDQICAEVDSELEDGPDLTRLTTSESSLSTPTKKKRRSRVKFTPKMRKICYELFQTHGNILGRSNSPSENMEKAAAWDNFTLAFNMATGMQISKYQLRCFFKRNIDKFSEPSSVDQILAEAESDSEMEGPEEQESTGEEVRNTGEEDVKPLIFEELGGLLLTWQCYKEFETLSYDESMSMSDFIQEWKQKLKVADDLGCRYSSTLLAFRLLEQSNVDPGDILLFLARLEGNVADICSETETFLLKHTGRHRAPPHLKYETNLGSTVKEDDLSPDSLNGVVKHEPEKAVAPVVPQQQDTDGGRMGDEFVPAEQHSAQSQSYPCNVCGIPFPNKLERRLHRKQEHGQAFQDKHLRQGDWRTPGANAVFQCEFCAKIFNNMYLLKNHLKTHSAEKPFKCTECPKAFWNTQSLECHLRVHTGERPYQCDDCGMAFKYGQNLKLHKEGKHTRHFKCDQCEQSFNRRRWLVNHQRIHQGLPVYVCPTCLLPFAKVCRRREHERIHLGKRPYPCKFCEKTFITGGNRAKHMRLKHPSLLE